jgi:hypothetical protein
METIVPNGLRRALPHNVLSMNSLSQSVDFSMLSGGLKSSLDPISEANVFKIKNLISLERVRTRSIQEMAK